MAIKPILFNTDMVQALLREQKTATRRVVKYTARKVYDMACVNGLWHETHDPQNPPERLVEWYVKNIAKSPYQPGDILYVRETWSRKQATQCLGITAECPYESCESANGPCFGYEYIFQAEPTDHLPTGEKWRPSIHMPKDVARIFLRVTGVRVERLQSITPEQLRAEGFYLFLTPSECKSMFNRFGAVGDFKEKRKEFSLLWDSTIKPADRAVYGWAANPWVWVIEFERIYKDEVKT